MIAAWPASATRFLAIRLMPGDDFRPALTALFDDEPEPSGFIASCIGSLSQASLRYAGEDNGQTTNGPLEIVSLSGTLSDDGVHLHAALSDANGHMVGGHVLAGCRVRTTAEIIVGLTDAVRFRRLRDPATGYAELTLQRGLADDPNQR